MVRLVFRPYTQVRRTICTSVSLRASTRVSSGFASLRHSSPSFGSRQACSNSNPSQKIGVGRRCTPPRRGGSRPSASLRLPGFARPSTRTHIRLLGPCFKTGRMGSPRAVAWSASVPRGARRGGARRIPGRAGCTSAGGIDRPGFGRRHGPQRSPPRAERRTGSSPFRIRPRRIAGPHPLPSRQFQALFDSLFKVLFIFPSRYLFAIGLSPVFSLGRNLPPNWGCIPKQPDSPTAPRGAAGPGRTGLSPSPAPLSRGLGPGPSLRTLLQTTIREARPPDSQAGLVPVRSPLLGESS